MAWRYVVVVNGYSYAFLLVWILLNAFKMVDSFETRDVSIFYFSFLLLKSVCRKTKYEFRLVTYINMFSYTNTNINLNRLSVIVNFFIFLLIYK